jgi:DNA repair protein RadC
MEKEMLWIQDAVPSDRPRERLHRLGARSLADAELLALVLRTGYRGHPVLTVAKAILAEHPPSQLIAMPLHHLRKIQGVGPARASALIAAFELIRRAQATTESDFPTVQSANDLIGHTLELRSKKKEHLVAFFVNARNQLLSKEVISIGTLTASLAHPREIFAPAIGTAAAGIILAHNHPSGDPSPSDEDIRLTQRIVQAGRILGIELIDHLIVAEKGCYSFKNEGRMGSAIRDRGSRSEAKG